MSLFFFFLLVLVCFLLMVLFFLGSKKVFWDCLTSSAFECGFSSWFFSRFSFSIHYFMIALIFLFLDLELCLIMPFMSFSLSSLEIFYILSVFLLILVLGLLYEWVDSKIEWFY